MNSETTNIISFKDYFHSIIVKFINYPADLSVEEDIGKFSNNIKIKLNSADIGLVIGKEGINIQAIKTIALLVGSRSKRRIFIQLLD